MNATASEGRRRLMANMRRLRKQHGWSQEKLAAKCGLHRIFVSSVERGERNISLDNIDRLAQALEVDAQDLLTAPPAQSSTDDARKA